MSELPKLKVYEKIKNLLTEAKAKFRVIEHIEEGRSEHIAKIRQNRPEQGAKAMVLELRSEGKEKKYVLAILPANRRLNYKTIATKLGIKKAAMASQELVFSLTQAVSGAVPPFSFHDDLQMMIDPLLFQNDEIVFNAGRLDRSIFLDAKDYEKIAIEKNSIFIDFSD